jgi:hypothetical protein
MENDTDKLIKEQFESLPEPLQRAITLTPWKELVRKVAQESNLDADKSQALETETMLVMYGFEPQAEFAKNIISELSIDSGGAGNISKSINEKVFSVVLAKAEELSQNTEPTLQSTSTPEQKPETQEIAPTVVVEKAAPDTARPSINLIMPEPEEKLLEAPKPEASPVTLAPSQPVESKPANIVEEKLREVVTSSPQKMTAYPDGKDPYREPTI